VIPSDVVELAADVLRHRLVLSYAGLAEGITPDSIISRIVGVVPTPRLETLVAESPA
jgi:MoxR-like ATPase